MTENTFEPQTAMERGMKRAEWGVIVSLIMSMMTAAWSVGVVWQTVQEHDRRLLAAESKLDTITMRIERIDANVTFLADRAREDRESRR